MSEVRTKATTLSVTDFLNAVEPEQKRADSLVLLKLFEKVTGEKAVMWGPTMVGFGKYQYKSTKSAQQGEWFLTGFSPRKQNLTLYIMHGNEESPDLKTVGKFKAGMGCMYINKLADVDQELLAKMIDRSFHADRMYSI